MGMDSNISKAPARNPVKRNGTKAPSTGSVAGDGYDCLLKRKEDYRNNQIAEPIFTGPRFPNNDRGY